MLSQTGRGLLAYPKISRYRDVYWASEAMVMGEVTSCLHINIQVGPVTGFSKCVSQFGMVGYYIFTTLQGSA